MLVVGGGDGVLVCMWGGVRLLIASTEIASMEIGVVYKIIRIIL